MIGGGAVFVYLGVFAYNAHQTRTMLVTEIERFAVELSQATRTQIDAVLGRVEATPRNFARLLTHSDMAGPALRTALCTVVESEWPVLITQSARPIYGAAVAFEPSTLERQRRFAPYCHQHEGSVRFLDLSQDNYSYETKQWYRRAVDSGAEVWSEPYEDEGGGDVFMATFSVPFFRTVAGETRIGGVATADLALEWLQWLASESHMGRGDFIVIVDGSGEVIAHSGDATKILTSTIVKITDPFPELHGLPERMAAQESDILSAVGQERGAVWVAFGPLRNGWSLAVVIPKATMLDKADELWWKTLALGVAGALLLAGLVTLLARRVARPISRLAESADRIADGDLDVPLRSVATGDEIETLARSFSKMRDALKDHIAKAARDAADEARHASNMRIAREIQMGIVPSSFERIIGDAPIEIAATLIPAKEVGGDLYDAFPLGPGRLCIVAGDVSGKDIPAAMFMTMATTALRSIAREIDEPGRMLARLNDQLAEENPSQTFLTVFCGVLDIASGRLSYASGGHTSPVLLREGEAPRFTVSEAGNLVGCVPELVFPRGQLQLLVGDVVILYTDGVTEALNETDELFGEERLLESFGERSGRTAQDAVDELVAAVQAFAGDAPQADDIGILTLRYDRH